LLALSLVLALGALVKAARLPRIGSLQLPAGHSEQAPTGAASRFLASIVAVCVVVTTVGLLVGILGYSAGVKTLAVVGGVILAGLVVAGWLYRTTMPRSLQS
jgi:hypothetical protein